MLERGDVARELSGYFRDTLHLDVASADAELTLDSMGIVELLLHVEQQYKVEIPMHELDVDDLASATRIADLVVRLATKEEERADGRPSPAA